MHNAEGFVGIVKVSFNAAMVASHAKRDLRSGVERACSMKDVEHTRFGGFVGQRFGMSLTCGGLQHLYTLECSSLLRSLF